jgi:hypothetical protein
MKKFILFLTATTLFSFASAQSFMILDTLGNDITSATVNVYGNETDLASVKANVVNINSIGLNVKVKRIENSLVSGTDNYFCWTLCYGPGTNQSPTAEYVAADDTIKKFIGDLSPNGYTGTSTVTYVFFDNANTNDSAFFTVNYIIYPTGLKNINSSACQVSAYPNPVSSDLKLQYKINTTDGSKIVIYNMLGVVVKSIDLTAIEGKINLVVSDLKQGVYFYSLYSEGKNIITRKLTVTR